MDSAPQEPGQCRPVIFRRVSRLLIPPMILVEFSYFRIGLINTAGNGLFVPADGNVPDFLGAKRIRCHHTPCLVSSLRNPALVGSGITVKGFLQIRHHSIAMLIYFPQKEAAPAMPFICQSLEAVQCGPVFSFLIKTFPQLKKPGRCLAAALHNSPGQIGHGPVIISDFQVLLSQIQQFPL